MQDQNPLHRRSSEAWPHHWQPIKLTLTPHFLIGYLLHLFSLYSLINTHVRFSVCSESSFQKWIILAPRRANHPDVAKGSEPVCPFCLGKENEEKELYRVGGKAGDSDWQVRVIHNKFPFAPIHEVIIHSPDHHKNFGELSQDQVELIFQTYRIGEKQGERVFLIRILNSLFCQTI